MLQSALKLIAGRSSVCSAEMGMLDSSTEVEMRIERVRLKRCWVGMLLAAQLLISKAEAQIVPLVSETVIRASTTIQDVTSSARTRGGGVVAWNEVSSNSYGIFARQVSPYGEPVGELITVANDPGLIEERPGVAADADGNFIIVWQSRDANGRFSSTIKGRRFSAAGVPVGNVIDVNTFAGGNKSWPKVAVEELTGNFIVAWFGSAPQGNQEDVYARRFSSNGVPLDTTEVTINEYVSGSQQAPDLEFLNSGDVILVWHSFSAQSGDSLDGSIRMRRFSSSLVPLTSEIQVNTFAEGDQVLAKVASLPSGGFLAVWQSFPQIRGRLYSASSNPIDDDFQINSEGGVSGNSSPDAAVSELGSILVVWQRVFPAAIEIVGRVIDPAGVLVGSDLQVNTTLAGQQAYPSVADVRGGGLVAFWSTNNLPTGYWIGARTYLPDLDGDNIPDPIDLCPYLETSVCIFGDGFESGDLSAWASVAP